MTEKFKFKIINRIKAGIHTQTHNTCSHTHTPTLTPTHTYTLIQAHTPYWHAHTSDLNICMLRHLWKHVQVRICKSFRLDKVSFQTVLHFSKPKPVRTLFYGARNVLRAFKMFRFVCNENANICFLVHALWKRGQSLNQKCVKLTTKSCKKQHQYTLWITWWRR